MTSRDLPRPSQVYANMTRFQWAYPSGVEDVYNQWVSGSTMVLVTAIMNMIYLTSETRTRVGERGINDPTVKLLITLLTFCWLWGMSVFGVLDPSLEPDSASAASADANATSGVVDPFDLDLPLPTVCVTQRDWLRGLGIFVLVVGGCLGFVVFVTSKQSLSGLKHLVSKRAPPPPLRPTRRDRLLGQCCLFGLFCLVCVAIITFFATVHLWQHGTGRARRTVHVDACSSVDEAALRAMGIY